MSWLSDKAPHAREQQQQEAVAAFEETLVKRILRRGNVNVPIGRAKKDAQQLIGESFMSFAWFRRRFPSFPLYMAAVKIPFTHEIKVGQLFGAEFAKLPFWKAYHLAAEQLDIDIQNERLALFFSWAGIAQGGSAMVLHNYPIASQNVIDPHTRTERGTRLIRPYGNDPPVVYVIEAMDDFLESVGDDWSHGVDFSLE